MQLRGRARARGAEILPCVGTEGIARSRRGDPDALRVLRHGLRVSASDAQRVIDSQALWASRRRNAAHTSSCSSDTNSSALCACAMEPGPEITAGITVP